MLRHPFLAFWVIVSSLIAGALLFIQSPRFAVVIKGVIARYLPKEGGVSADFTSLSIKLFPPGISIQNPKIAIGERNVAGLPAGSAVEAERMDFIFKPLQALSGDIRIHEVSIVNGDLRLDLKELLPGLASSASSRSIPTPKKKDRSFHWDELFQIRAEAISLQDVKIHLLANRVNGGIQVNAENVRIAQWAGKGGLGYSLHVQLKEIQGVGLKKYFPPGSLERLDVDATVNALGVQLTHGLVLKNGVQLTGEGTVSGDVLRPKELLAEIKVKLVGPLRELAEITRSFQGQLIQSKTMPEGELELTGSVRGDLLKSLETFEAEGEVEVRKVAFQGWAAETVRADLKWDADRDGGKLSIEKAIIASPIQARSGGTQPGGGGLVEIGPLNWRVGSNAEIDVPLRFEHAHIHWLAAPFLEKVYPLDLRLNGFVKSVFRPHGSKRGSTWGVEADLATWVEDFQLDNQRLNKTKRQKVVFSSPRIGLNGVVTVNSSGIFSPEITLSLPHTNLRLVGGIDFKSGLDLRGGGEIDLSDLGQVAESEIRGRGEANIRVHGPTSKILVDLDLDVKEAAYLHLRLGDLKGRFTWDDDPENLLFSKIMGNQAGTEYSVNGILETKGVNQINIDVDILRGNIQNFIQIFHYLVADLGWFPHDLNGAMGGKIEVRGETDLSKLQILGEVHGKNWENWGEHFKSVRLVGGYDRGKYLLSQIQILKRIGSIFGKFSHDAIEGYDWNIWTEGLTLRDLDHIGTLEVPFRGKLNFISSGTSEKDGIRSFTKIDCTEFLVRGNAASASHLSLKTANGMSTVRGTAMGSQGTLELDYNFDKKAPSRLQVGLDHLDFTPILLILNPKSIEDQALKGVVSGEISLDFHAGEIEKANGFFGISEYKLARHDTKFSLEKPIEAQVVNGTFEVEELAIRGPTGNVTLGVKSSPSRLDGSDLKGHILGSLDASFVEFFTQSVSQASGEVKLDLILGGKLKEPTLQGQAVLSVGSAKLNGLESPFENMTGILRLSKNILSVQGVRSDMGGGRMSMDGSLILYPDRYPEINLKGALKESKVKVYPFQFAKVTGNFGIRGESLPYLIDGKLLVDSALSKEKVLNQKQGPGSLKVLLYAPPPGKRGSIENSSFRLDVDVDAPRGIRVENDLFRDVQIRGKVKLVNTVDSPRVLGSAEVMQGKLLFKDHIFQIQSGVAHFDNPTVINPRFEMNANTEVNGVKIQMYASGRKDQIRVEFNSNPAMPESEILSLLAVGLTSNDAKKLSATDLSAVQQGEAASLVLNSLDFNRDLEDKTGFQVQLDETVNPRQGVSAFRPQAQIDSAAAPQITIRRKIGKRLSLSAGRTFGTGTVQSNQVNLDFSVNKNFSITGVFNSYGTNGTADTQLFQQNSLGFDLKYQKRFK